MIRRREKIEDERNRDCYDSTSRTIDWAMGYVKPMIPMILPEKGYCCHCQGSYIPKYSDGEVKRKFDLLKKALPDNYRAKYEENELKARQYFTVTPRDAFILAINMMIEYLNVSRDNLWESYKNKDPDFRDHMGKIQAVCSKVIDGFKESN